VKQTARYPLAPAAALAALVLIAWAEPGPAAGPSAQGGTAAAPAGPLAFPKDAFTEETLTVRTSRGEKTVVYRSYRHIPYVAKSVDKDYQSLDVRHFTEFSLRHATGDPNARLDDDIPLLVNLMNPMYFILRDHPGIANYWWIRLGTSDAHTSLTVAANLAAGLANRGKNVSALMYWDAGHGADLDAEDFIGWIAAITGFPARK
jgi:hypothetical protein